MANVCVPGLSGRYAHGSASLAVPSFSVHPDELAESTKTKLNDRAYFYANSNAGLGWTDRANREAFYKWRIIPRMLVDTNTRDLTSELSQIYLFEGCIISTGKPS